MLIYSVMQTVTHNFGPSELRGLPVGLSDGMYCPSLMLHGVLWFQLNTNLVSIFFKRKCLEFSEMARALRGKF